MWNLTKLLGIAPSPKKEKVEQKPNPPSYSVMTDMRKRINAEEPFTLVYIELVKNDGKVVGDAKYVSDLIGGQTMSERSVGVVVPFGHYQRVYNKLEELAQAPFASDMRIGYSSFPGSSDDPIHLLGNVLSDAQNCKAHRKYAGKQPPESLGEKVLECA